MSDFAKADGAKIQITFSEPLIGDVSGNQAAFKVTVPEKAFVPTESIKKVDKTVLSTYPFSACNSIVNLTKNATLTDTVVKNGTLSLGVQV